MKIRTDFVTNSSSSSFSVVVSIHTQDETIEIEEYPYSYNPDEGGEASFNSDLREIDKHLSSVESLATWLADSISCYVGGNISKQLKNHKETFIEEAKSKIKSIDEIERVEVTRNYSAWGEFADLVADNDAELVKLAHKYVNSQGIEQERIEAEIVTHIHTTTNAKGESFGFDSINSRYDFDSESIDRLAHRLCSNYGPGETAGWERKEINLKTGEYYDESEFVLE